MVNGAGDAVVDTSPVNELALRALAAFIVGGMLALIVTFLKPCPSTQVEMNAFVGGKAMANIATFRTWNNKVSCRCCVAMMTGLAAMAAV